MKARSHNVPLATDYLLVAFLSQNPGVWENALPEPRVAPANLIADVEKRLLQNRAEQSVVAPIRGQIEEEAWSALDIAIAESILKSSAQISVGALLLGVLTSSDAGSPNRATKILSDIGLDVIQFRSNLRSSLVALATQEETGNNLEP
jgi:hypothetical protein